jgi:hypothetical protein
MKTLLIAVGIVVIVSGLIFAARAYQFLDEPLYVGD